MSFLRITPLAVLFTIAAPAAYSQNAQQGLLRALNAQALQLRGAAASENAGDSSAARSQAADTLARRQEVLESLMAAEPARALELTFPDDVLADLAEAFPDSAGALEQRGTWRGTLYYVVEEGVDFATHKEIRKLKIGDDLVDVFSPSETQAGSKCNDRIAASGVRSGNSMVVESSIVEETAAGCSNQGAQKIAVILVNFPSTSLPSNITQEFLQGVFLGNAFTNPANQVAVNRSIDDFWTQNSDGKTWVNNSGTGALTVVGPYTLAADYTYCPDYGPVRTAAYAAANGALDYNQFSRVVLVLPHNGSCNGTAGVASIGCWGSECPGDGACNISWTWWRADQIWNRDAGTMLGTHELGHNLGVSHSGSRYHGAQVVENIGVAGFRTEYNDKFGTMGSWNLGFYNAPHALNTLGWLTSANVQTVTSTGVYTIQGYETRPAGIKALKVARGTGTTNAYFYVAYYPDRGDYIGALGTAIHGGAIIHYADSATPGLKTDLLDFTPTEVNTSTTTPNFTNPILANGAIWTDPYKDVQIQVTDINTVNNTMTVSVTYSPPPCTPANPTVTFLTTNNSVSPGGSANYTVRVANNDSGTCSARNFDMTASQVSSSEPSIGLNYTSSALNVAAGGTADTTLVASTTVDTPLNTYIISATATAGANTDSTNTNASLTVQNLPPATPTGVSATAVFTGNGKNKVFQYIRFSWGDVANETSYTVQRCQLTGKGKSQTCNYSILSSLAANTTQIQDVPDSKGTYRYQVRADNSVTGLSSGWSAAVQANR